MAICESTSTNPHWLFIAPKRSVQPLGAHSCTFLGGVSHRRTLVQAVDEGINTQALPSPYLLAACSLLAASTRGQSEASRA